MEVEEKKDAEDFDWAVGSRYLYRPAFVYCTSRGQDSREHWFLERIGRQIIYEIPMEWEWSSEENRHYYQIEVDGESIYLTMLLYNQGNIGIKPSISP